VGGLNNRQLISVTPPAFRPGFNGLKFKWNICLTLFRSDIPCWPFKAGYFLRSQRRWTSRTFKRHLREIKKKQEGPEKRRAAWKTSEAAAVFKSNYVTLTSKVAAGANPNPLTNAPGWWYWNCQWQRQELLWKGGLCGASATFCPLFVTLILTSHLLRRHHSTISLDSTKSSLTYS